MYSHADMFACMHYLCIHNWHRNGRVVISRICSSLAALNIVILTIFGSLWRSFTGTSIFPLQWRNVRIRNFISYFTKEFWKAFCILILYIYCYVWTTIPFSVYFWHWFYHHKKLSLFSSSQHRGLPHGTLSCAYIGFISYNVFHTLSISGFWTL